MTEPAPAAAPATSGTPASNTGVTITPSSDEPSGDMFSDATSFHDFQQQVKARDKQQRAEANAQKPKPPLSAAKTQTKPAESQQPKEQQPVETPPPEQPLGEPPPDAPPEETPAEPPPDPTQEEAAEQELLGKVRDWMKNGGEVPAEMLDVPVPLPNGRLEPLSEVIKGYMRQDDHTNGWREMEQVKAQSQAAVQAYEQHFTQIEDPDPVKGGEAMYEVYTRGPRRAAFMEAARKLALDEQEDITHAQGYAIAFARRERLIDQQGQPLWNHRDVSKAYDDAIRERERIRFDRDMGRQREWELERERAQNRAHQQAKKQVEVNQTVENQLRQMRPRAFKQLGIADDSETQVLFRRKLAARAEQVAATVLTPELVMEAARMTRDHIERERSGSNGNGHAAKPAARPYQPQLGGGAGKMNGSQKAEPMTDEQFAAKFGLRKL